MISLYQSWKFYFYLYWNTVVLVEPSWGLQIKFDPLLAPKVLLEDCWPMITILLSLCHFVFLFFCLSVFLSSSSLRTNSSSEVVLVFLESYCAFWVFVEQKVPKLLILMHLRCYSIIWIVAIYALLFRTLKFWSCKIFDKSHVWISFYNPTTSFQE